MEKKDIYEHLAKIYLDTPLKRSQRIRTPERINRKVVIIVAVVAVAVLSTVIFSLSAFLKKTKQVNSQTEQIILPEAVKLDFSLDPAKKAVYSIALNKANLIKFKTMEFSLKKSDFNASLALRVEFSNSYNERSEIYVKDILNKWKGYKIPFADFKSISDWSEITSLSFIVEEWNAADKKGAVYIDNVRFLQ